MKIIDKIHAKILGVSEERYTEAIKIAEDIWVSLYNDNKLIDPSAHLKNIGISYDFGNLVWGIETLSLWEIVIINFPNIDFKTINILIPAICSLIYFICRIFVFKHDLKQFSQRLKEIIEIDKNTK